MNATKEIPQLGLCVKTKEKVVLHQDQQCIDACGDMLGQICTKGCMEKYASVPGMTLVKNSQTNNGLVDALVINDQDKLTTLLYQHKNDASNDDMKIMRAKLISFGLTKSELAIFLRVLQGARNSEIAKEFFISKATLKTHLNNIYKKLPEQFQQYKLRR